MILKTKTKKYLVLDCLLLLVYLVFVFSIISLSAQVTTETTNLAQNTPNTRKIYFTV